MWCKSDEGTLKIYYSDVDTNQWVDASPIGDPFENTYASIAIFPQANLGIARSIHSKHGLCSRHWQLRRGARML